MKKENYSFLKFCCLILFALFAVNVSAQVYKHNFGTINLVYPYNVAPAIQNAAITNSVWTNSNGSWAALLGSTGNGMGVNTNATTATTVTLNFDVASGNTLTLTSFNFWRKRTPSATRTWTMSVNGTQVGTETLTSANTTGASIGLQTLTTPMVLTGSVTITIVLNNPPSGGNGSFVIDDFELNGTVGTACTPPTVTSISPASGPAGTVITITGNGFEAGAGTSSVKFNGVEAAGFTVVSATSIKAVVPAGVTTGAINITTDGCSTNAQNFTAITTNCASSGGTDIYISELYDQREQSGGMIEIYNPTANAINLNGYTLKRYGNAGDTTPTYTLNMTGSIPSESTYLIACDTPLQNFCATPPANAMLDNGSGGSGFNGNDKFELLKNNAVIDLVLVPFTGPGFTLIRKPDAVAPSATYVEGEWNNTQHGTAYLPVYCADLGNHTVNALPLAAITTQPVSDSKCENGQAQFSVAVSNAAGFTYQWKVLNAAGNWVNVVNDANYTGANTATLTVNQIPLSFNLNQYYCAISSATCTLVSNAVQLTVSPIPVVVINYLTQPTCTTTTGSFDVVPSVGTNLTYSFNGGPFQAGTTFTGIAPGSYNLEVKSAANCSATVSVVINPTPAAPTQPVLVSAAPATCTATTGTITVTAPVGAGLTYSIDGVNFVTTTTFNVTPGNYTVTVKNAAGCTNTNTTTVAPAPAGPAQPVLVAAAPATCTSTTGTITVTAPVGAGLTYSIDGVNFVTTTTFNVTPGNYTVTVKNAAGCTNTNTTTVAPAPAGPAQPVLVAAAPATCTSTTGTITVTAPVGAGLTYSIDGVNFVTTTTFNVTPGNYTVTVKNAAGCTNTNTTTVAPAPAGPAQPVLVAAAPATCTSTTGTITVTAPVGAGLTYSIDGVNFVTTTTFNVTPGNYTVTVKNAAGCTNTNTTTVAPAPAGPAQPVLVAAAPATCTSTTGTITVTAPVGAGLTYSIDGVNFVTTTTFNVTPGNYTVTVKNAAGCTNTNTTTVAPAPTGPSQPVLASTAPVCGAANGTITVTAPVGTGFTYSIDGITFQTATTFTTAPGNYTVTVKNAAGCTNTNTVTVAPSSGTSIDVTGLQGCEDTAFGKNYILNALPVNGSFDINTATFEWRNESGAVVSTTGNTFNVTEYLAGISNPSFPMDFVVKVTSAAGCQNTHTFTVQAALCSIPKGISPNNDGKNDRFDLTGFSISKLEIFNRYGRKVYSRSNYSNEWVGQDNNANELPTGTYYYMIETGSESKTGWVYINREE